MSVTYILAFQQSIEIQETLLVICACTVHRAGCRIEGMFRFVASITVYDVAVTYVLVLYKPNCLQDENSILTMTATAHSVERSLPREFKARVYFPAMIQLFLMEHQCSEVTYLAWVEADAQATRSQARTDAHFVFVAWWAFIWSTCNQWAAQSTVAAKENCKKQHGFDINNIETTLVTGCFANSNYLLTKRSSWSNTCFYRVCCKHVPRVPNSYKAVYTYSEIFELKKHLLNMVGLQNCSIFLVFFYFNVGPIKYVPHTRYFMSVGNMLSCERDTM